MELFYTPASKLDTFVAKCLHPHKECKEEVLEAVRTVKKFLWQQCFPGKNVQVLEVRLIPSIPRPGLGKTQHEGPSPWGYWGTSCFIIPSPCY